MVMEPVGSRCAVSRCIGFPQNLVYGIDRYRLVVLLEYPNDDFLEAV